MKHEKAIGVAIGIGEIELFAFPQLHAQILVLVVDLERFEIAERRTEPILLVSGLVANTVDSRDQASSARAHAMLVHDGDRGVESRLTKAEGEIARARLDVDRLRDTLEPFGRHVDLVRARFHALRGQRRGADKLPVDEYLCPWHIGIDAQRTKLDGSLDGRGWFR